MCQLFSLKPRFTLISLVYFSVYFSRQPARQPPTFRSEQKKEKARKSTDSQALDLGRDYCTFEDFKESVLSHLFIYLIICQKSLYFWGL